MRMAWKTGQQQEGGSGGATQQQTLESLCPLTCAFNVQPGNSLGWEQFLKIEEPDREVGCVQLCQTNLGKEVRACLL